STGLQIRVSWVRILPSVPKDIMATASTRKELQEVDDRVKLYFYIQNLRYAERNRELSITVHDTVND
ncbi:MAG: hypothetical protein KAR39_04580, partial [Thermoplasmata archaeon]|nr:hypothetical protein [Thermoplasmata archaeon]